MSAISVAPSNGSSMIPAQEIGPGRIEMQSQQQMWSIIGQQSQTVLLYSGDYGQYGGVALTKQHQQVNDGTRVAHGQYGGNVQSVVSISSSGLGISGSYGYPAIQQQQQANMLMTPPCQPTAQGQQMTVGHSSLWSHQSSGSGQSSSSYSHGNLTQQPSVVRMGGAPNPVAFGNSSQFLSHSDYAGNSQNQQIRIAPYSDQPGLTSQKKLWPDTSDGFSSTEHVSYTHVDVGSSQSNGQQQIGLSSRSTRVSSVSLYV